MNKLIASMIAVIALMHTAVCAEKITLKTGSGSFIAAGGKNRSDKIIEVYYHKPESFSAETKVLFVIPGAGRNGWSYRDAWIEASEKHDILILSPSYAEKYYPEFWSYNLGGMVDNVVINEERTAILSLDIVTDTERWIYTDFDRIFNKVVHDLALNTEQYDMFGHSAGGQVLHRFVLFNPDNKANRILAGNSGWYTAPDFTEEFPYGLKNSPLRAEKIKHSFSNKLTVFLGEMDNQNETRGHLVRNEVIDKQGTFRLSRGQYFYKKAKQLAEQREYPFKWNLHIVRDVGHNYRAMSQAAALYLYE